MCVVQDFFGLFHFNQIPLVLDDFMQILEILDDFEQFYEFYKKWRIPRVSAKRLNFTNKKIQKPDFLILLRYCALINFHQISF